MSIPDIGEHTMRKTTKTTKTPARRVRETTATYRPRKAKAAPAPAPTPEPTNDWSRAFAAAKNAVVTDVTRPVGSSRTKQVGIGAALVGAGFGIAALLR